jgi:hypothetical protein
MLSLAASSALVPLPLALMLLLLIPPVSPLLHRGRDRRLISRRRRRGLRWRSWWLGRSFWLLILT